MTGLTAGAGNMVAGGSFLGSTVDPGNVAGIQKLGTMFTPDNPFTSAVSSKITGVAADVAGLGGKVGGGVFKQDFGGQEVIPDVAPTDLKSEVVDTKVVGSTRSSGGQSADFMDGVRKAFKPGDEYGFDDFFKEYLSPGRANISAEAQKGYQKDLAAFNKKFPDASAGDYTSYIKTLDAKYAPGAFTKFGPLAATAAGAGVASDTILGTNIIIPPEEEKVDLAAMQNQGSDLLVSDPGKFGIDESYLANNPFYDGIGINPPAPEVPFIPPFGIGSMNYGQYAPSFPPIRAASGGEIVGPGTPTSDSVPAMLSDGEFVMNARAVKGAGGGDRQQGAKRMYEMMRSFERTA